MINITLLISLGVLVALILRVIREFNTKDDLASVKVKIIRKVGFLLLILGVIVSCFEYYQIYTGIDEIAYTNTTDLSPTLVAGQVKILIMGFLGFIGLYVLSLISTYLLTLYRQRIFNKRG